MAVGFSACEKLDTGTPDTPVAGLMAFNLVTDKEAIGVAIEGNSISNVPLYFTNYTGGYQGVFVGNRNLESFDYNTRQPLATSSQVFEDSAYYSLFVIGTDGNYDNVLVKDNLNSLPTNTTESFVRYVNAIVDSTQAPIVKVSSNGTDVFNGAANYGYVSEFKGVAPGEISIAASSESIVDANRTISVEQGKIYTILLTGDPAATDTSRKVAIKFITNGEVSE